MATVIGPTPPGTGVIQLDFILAVSKSTSPTNLEPDAFDGSEVKFVYIITQNNGVKKALSYFWVVLPGIELMPQSITTAPCFIQSPFTILGCPIPTISMSAPETLNPSYKMLNWS